MNFAQLERIATGRGEKAARADRRDALLDCAITIVKAASEDEFVARPVG